MPTTTFAAGDTVTRPGDAMPWSVVSVRGDRATITRGSHLLGNIRTDEVPTRALRLVSKARRDRSAREDDRNWLDDLLGRMHDQIRAERAGRQRAANEALLTAYDATEHHEAGHAAIAHYFGADLLGVTTVRGDRELGLCAYDPESLIDAETRRPMQAVIALAGRAAERLAPSWGPALADNTGHEDDQRSALRFVDGDQAALRNLERYTAELVDEHRLEIAVLAAALHDRGSVDGPEAAQILDDAVGIATRAGRTTAATRSAASALGLGEYRTSIVDGAFHTHWNATRGRTERCEPGCPLAAAGSTWRATEPSASGRARLRGLAENRSEYRIVPFTYAA